MPSDQASAWVELIRQIPAIIAAVFSGIAVLVGMKNRKQVKTIDEKTDKIGVMVDGHASAQAAAIKDLHAELLGEKDKRIEDVKAAASQTAADVKEAIQSAASTVSAAVAPDASKPTPVVVVDRRKGNGS